jgi:hypothetical protein
MTQGTCVTFPRIPTLLSQICHAFHLRFVHYYSVYFIPGNKIRGHRSLSTYKMMLLIIEKADSVHGPP